MEADGRRSAEAIVARYIRSVVPEATIADLLSAHASPATPPAVVDTSSSDGDGRPPVTGEQAEVTAVPSLQEARSHPFREPTSLWRVVQRAEERAIREFVEEFIAERERREAIAVTDSRGVEEEGSAEPGSGT